jgi:SAM-dependent methyltransferase
MKICCKCSEAFDNLKWQCPYCYYKPVQIDGYKAFAPELAKAGESYNPTFFSKLANLEAKNFWFRSRNRLIIWALQHYFPRAKSFLEIGCGTGFVLSGIELAFPTLALYGSEIFTQGLGFAAQRLSRVELFQMDARAIPFKNEFDVIGAFDVIEHIKEDRIVLSEMYRAVRQGGGIILSVPQHPWLWSSADEAAHHVRRYRRQELRAKVERAGFKVVRMTSFVSLLLPLMMLSRLQQRKPNANYDLLSELSISGLANTLLERILDLERLAIHFGCSWLAGGSLLLIAQK